MKILLLLTITALVLCGCTSKVESYLKKNEPNLTALEIIEEVQIDSVYSPSHELMAMSQIYSELHLKMNQYASKAWKAKSKKESIQCFDSALTSHKEISNVYDSLFFACCLVLDFPELDRKRNNRKAIKAKYRMNGIMKEQLFYLNKDGKTIGHAESDNKKIARDLMSERDKVNKIKNEIESEKSDMKYNRTSSRSWN